MRFAEKTSRTRFWEIMTWLHPEMFAMLGFQPFLVDIFFWTACQYNVVACVQPLLRLFFFYLSFPSKLVSHLPLAFHSIQPALLAVFFSFFFPHARSPFHWHLLHFFFRSSQLHMGKSANISPGNMTWKAFVRASRPTFLCASPKTNIILVRLSYQPVGNVWVPLKARPLRWDDLSTTRWLQSEPQQ